MVALPIITGLIGVGQTYLNNLIGQRVMRDLRNNLYDHLQAMSLRFFSDTRTGEIQSRLSNDVGGVQNVITNTATSVVSNVTTTVSTIAAMFLISWQLTVLSLALLPVFVYITYRVGSLRRELSKSTQRSMADMTALTQETLSVSGILLTKTFGRQEQSSQRFRHENQNLADLFQLCCDCHVSLILAGHEHNYERLGPSDGTGQPDANGPRSFVIGTGGVGLRGFDVPALSITEQRLTDQGIVCFTLTATTYSWQFLQVNTDAILDQGSGTAYTV